MVEPKGKIRLATPYGDKWYERIRLHWSNCWKEKYTEDGVHKGMTGWICYDKCVDGYWLVNFPQYGDKPDIATISVHESDMVKIAALNVQINEQIRKQFETKS